jgi:hypothetical protein
MQHPTHKVGILLGELPVVLARLYRFSPIGCHKLLCGPSGAKVELAFHLTSPHETRGLLMVAPPHVAAGLDRARNRPPPVPGRMGIFTI